VDILTCKVFLAKNADRAFSAETLAPPKPECQVCGVARVSVEANVSVATLGDLVEKVIRSGLGYGEDISVLTSQQLQLLYDIEYHDNLDTPLKELGFGDETFVTIRDEEEAEGIVPRVNLEIVVTHK
jgi:ubiquitin-like 1-activating enzyme E1 B